MKPFVPYGIRSVRPPVSVIVVVMAHGKNRIGRSRVTDGINLHSGAPTGKRDRLRGPGSDPAMKLQPGAFKSFRKSPDFK